MKQVVMGWLKKWLVVTLPFVESVVGQLRGWGIAPSREVMATMVAMAQALGPARDGHG